MFESILSEIEVIKNGLSKGNPGSNNESLVQEFHALKDAILQVRIPLPNMEFKRMESKFETITKHLSQIPDPGESRLRLLKRKLGFFNLLLLISGGLNIYLVWKLFV